MCHASDEFLKSMTGLPSFFLYSEIVELLNFLQ